MAIIQSGATTDVLTVDPVSQAARTTIYDTDGRSLVLSRGTNLTTTPTGLAIGGYNDSTFRVARFDRLGNIRTGFDQTLFVYSCEGGTVNSGIWNTSASTMTITQNAATGILFNAGSSIAASTYAILLSQKQFAKQMASPIRIRIRARVIPQTNSITEFGFGSPATTTAQIANGAFWRYTASGSVVPVISFNGSDVVTGTNVAASLVSTNYYSWTVVVDDDNVFFAVQNAATGQMVSEQTLQLPSTQPKVWAVTRLQAAIRLYNAATPPTIASQCYVSDVVVVGYDVVTNKPWNATSASIGLGSEAHPTTYAQTANWTNSTVPANATLANATASYTTLGGLFSFVAVAGGTTDYPLFAFTATSPYSLFVTSITIDTYNTGAAVATTPTLLHWGVVNNATSGSLATAGIYRSHIGTQVLPIGAVIGQNTNQITVQFPTPLRTDAGRIFTVMLRMPIATATASQVIQGGVLINGYYE